MHIPKNYFHDRLVLLFLTVNTFLTGLVSVIILLRLDSGRAESYIVQYRANLGIDAFQSGGSSTFIYFIAFALLTWVLHLVLSMRVYSQHRQLSLLILALGSLLLVMSLFISNALLVQR
jgi:hypothetical protein